MADYSGSEGSGEGGGEGGGDDTGDTVEVEVDGGGPGYPFVIEWAAVDDLETREAIGGPDRFLHIAMGGLRLEADCLAASTLAGWRSDWVGAMAAAQDAATTALATGSTSRGGTGAGSVGGGGSGSGRGAVAGRS